MRIVGGEWSGRRISAPTGRATRPTTDRVREAWMSAIQPEIGGARVLDLFAGSGALGLEALSRGAAHVTFVESAPAALRVLRKNLAQLQASEGRYQITGRDVMRYLGEMEGRADIALADPPYAANIASGLLKRWLAQPFCDLLCLEHDPSEALPADPVWTRRYGDSALSFFRSSDD